MNLENVPRSTHLQVDEESMREAQRQWLANAFWEAMGSHDKGPTVPTDWESSYRSHGYLPTEIGKATGTVRKTDHPYEEKDFRNFHDNLLMQLLKR